MGRLEIEGEHYSVTDIIEVSTGFVPGVTTYHALLYDRLFSLAFLESRRSEKLPSCDCAVEFSDFTKVEEKISAADKGVQEVVRITNHTEATVLTPDVIKVHLLDLARTMN